MSQKVRAKVSFGIDVPLGPLFYSCCGSDTSVPLQLFLGALNEFHFVDVRCIGLPITEASTNWRILTHEVFDKGRFQGARSGRIAMSPRWRIESSEIDIKVLAKATIEKAKTIADAPIEVWDRDTSEAYVENWCTPAGGQSKIFCHKNDGVIALMEMPGIAVFFYRGDSPGEGGSGQWWLGPKLFNRVMDKLLDGGLIVTDGSTLTLGILVWSGILCGPRKKIFYIGEGSLGI